MSDNMDVSELRDWRDWVLVTSHTGKHHVDPNCRYLRQRDADEIEHNLSTLPDWKVDLCTWCENYLERYKRGVESKPGIPTCERCGKKHVRKEYCIECHVQIRLKR